jgi:hypothetical protein
MLDTAWPSLPRNATGIGKGDYGNPRDLAGQDGRNPPSGGRERSGIARQGDAAPQLGPGAKFPAARRARRSARDDHGTPTEPRRLRRSHYAGIPGTARQRPRIGQRTTRHAATTCSPVAVDGDSLQDGAVRTSAREARRAAGRHREFPIMHVAPTALSRIRHGAAGAHPARPAAVRALPGYRHHPCAGRRAPVSRRSSPAAGRYAPNVRKVDIPPAGN